MTRIHLTETIFQLHDGRLVRRGGLPPRTERFQRIGIDVHRLMGVS